LFFSPKEKKQMNRTTVEKGIVSTETENIERNRETEINE
jgi:hypothetical protein